MEINEENIIKKEEKENDKNNVKRFQYRYRGKS